jgi:hypothetical protein
VVGDVTGAAEDLDGVGGDRMAVSLAKSLASDAR